MKKLVWAALLTAILLGALSLVTTVHAETVVAGWQVKDTGGHASESDGMITLSGDERAAGPNLYREFKPQTDFEVTFQLKAETLGEVHRDPAGAGEGFGFGFGTGLAPKSPGAAFELRARAGGQFLLVWHDDLCDRYGWDCNWIPFVYNGIGYNDGSAYWNSPVDRSNSTVKPDVWYTVKLKVTANPFTLTAEVYTENGMFLGSLTVDTINNFTFKDIRYVGMSSGFGGTFYVRNITGIAPVAKFTLSTDPAGGEGLFLNASESSPQDQIVDYFWDFGDNSVAHSIPPGISHGYPDPGAYNVTLTVWDVNGLNASYSQIIRVKVSTQISISAEPSCTVGSPINIYGNLTDYYGNGLANEPVVLKYGFPGAEERYPISSAFTDASGNYKVQWVTTATGTFILRAEWKGNDTHPAAYTNMTLNSLPLQDNSVFFVESNSTVASLAFNSATSELSFTVTGPSGTEGHVKTAISKSLLANAENLHVQLDGKQLNYTLTQTDNSWTLLFHYSHSTHQISVHVPLGTSPTGNGTPLSLASSSPASTTNPETSNINYGLLAFVLAAIAFTAILGGYALGRSKKTNLNHKTPHPQNRSLFPKVPFSGTSHVSTRAAQNSFI